MAKWVCYVDGCNVYALAPNVRPVHAEAPNPFFQAYDPHCPVHKIPLNWVPDFVAVAATPTAQINAPNDFYGIQVGTFMGTTPIYCDQHQRKHVYGGNWPGSTSTDKPLFRSGIYNRNNLAIPELIAAQMPWAKIKVNSGGADAVFDCGKTVVGTEGETHILVQGGPQTSRITFHAYPVEEDEKRAPAFKSARLKGLFMKLDLTAIVT
jgi:hypothetical protein